MQAEIEYKYLKFTSLEKTVFWDFYTLFNKNAIDSVFPIVKLSEVIIQRKGFITIDDNEMYKRCRVQIQGKGVVLRDEVIGKEIKTKKQQLCKADDFLVAEIDAKVGGFGIVPQELENAIVSGHYFLFEINKLKLLPEFLGLVVTQSEFLKQVKSTGSTNYSAIRPSHVLDYKIPLPKLEQQQEIITNYYSKVKEAGRLKNEAEDLEGKIESYLYEKLGLKRKEKKIFSSKILLVEYKDLDRWDGKNENILTSKYEVERIGKYITNISTGTTPPTSRQEYFIGDVNFYTPSELGSEMYLTKSERKLNEIAFRDKKARRFERGTILFVGIGSTVGKVGIVANDFASSNQQITGFNVNQNKLMNGYVYYYFKYFQEITVSEQTKATLPIVNQDKIMNIPIPIPPIPIQELIVSEIKKMISEIDIINKQSINLKLLAVQNFEKSIFN